MALRRNRRSGNEENQTVKVVVGYDVSNPIMGEITSEDTFETLLNKVAESSGMDANQLRNSGYSPIVSGRAYSFSDNVAKAMSETNSKEVQFMVKQKGGQ